MTNVAPPINWRERHEEDELYASRIEKLYSVGQYTPYQGAQIVSIADGPFKPPVRFCLETPDRNPDNFSCGFESELYDILGRRDVTLDKSQEAPEFLLQALGRVIKKRKAFATHEVWRCIKSHAGKPRLGDLEYTHITIDLVHFLLFRVQAPDLFCAMVHQHHPKTWHHGFGNSVQHGYKKEAREELVPLVAALMDAVLFVKRIGSRQSPMRSFEQDVTAHKDARKDWEGHDFASANGWWKSEVGAVSQYGTDTWWHVALMLLISVLPDRVYSVQRYHGNEKSPLQTTLLERAVLCSELSTVALEELMARCEFNQFDLRCAMDTALCPGNLRGATTVRVTSLLYRHLWKLRPEVWDPNSKEETNGSDALRHLKAAWTELFVYASDCKVACLTTTKSKRVVIPVQHSRDGAHSPELSVEIMNGFLSSWDSVPLFGSDHAVFAALVCHAMHVLLQCGMHKTYLVERLLEVERGFFDEYFYPDLLELPGFLGEFLTDHVDAFYINHFRGHFYGHRFTAERRDALLCEAFNTLVRRGARRGLRVLFDAMHELPDALKSAENLTFFILYVCKTKVLDGDGGGPLGRMITDEYIDDVAKTLRMYLKMGGSWDPKVLKKGLAFASANESSVAVEALVSAPYKVRHKWNDWFSGAIVAALLEPGETEAIATGKRFDKRKRGEDAVECSTSFAMDATTSW